VLAAQRRGHDVTETEHGLRAWMLRTARRMAQHVLVQPARLARERIDVREAVAAMDADIHRARPDAVARIQLAVALDRMPRAPLRLGEALPAELDAAAVGLVRIA